MPNYSLVINSRFRPFEYNDFLQPVLAATQAHQALEDAYGDLSTKADIWNNILNRETDSKAYNLYQSYSNDLQKQAEQLSKYGLSPSSRQEMINMRSRYSKDIVPIENAYNQREAEIKRQRDILDKTGGNTVFTRDARTTSIDKYLNNDVEDFQQINLDDVLKTGIAGGKAISERYIKTTEGRAFNNSYYNLITEQGYTPEEAIDILRNTGNYPEFERFVSDELTKRGISAYSDPDQQKVKSALMEGINLGITYKRTNSLHDDWRSKAILSADLADRNAERQEARAAARKRAEELAKAAQGEEEELNGLFNQRIFEGTTGNNSETLTRLEGLRPVVENGVKGISTTKRDKLVKDYNEAKKAYDNLHLTKQEQEALKHESLTKKPSTPTGQSAYGALGSAINQTSSKRKGYAEYQRMKNAKAALDAENQWLADKAREYTAYSPDIAAAFNIGTTLERSQMNQQNYTYGLNLDSSSYKNVKGGLGTLTTLGQGNMGLYNSKGKYIGKDKSKDILTSDDTAIGVSFTPNDIYLSATTGDGRYKIKGTQAIDDFNDKLTATNIFLKNFSPQRINSSVAVVNNQDFERIAQGDLRALPSGIKPQSIRGGITGITVQSRSGDAMNIVFNNNRILGISTLSDELYNQGKMREGTINHMAKVGLHDLLPSVAHTPKATEDEK